MFLDGNWVPSGSLASGIRLGGGLLSLVLPREINVIVGLPSSLGLEVVAARAVGIIV